MRGFSPQAFAAEDVGLTSIPVSSKARDTNLDVTIWYPAKGGDGTPALSSENRIFQGTAVRKDATIKDGHFPSC